MSIVIAGMIIFVPSILAWSILAIFLLTSAVIKRSLFFALVIPTTMPGAFFWKNEGFQQHAKETGLAKMPQVGVEYEKHREFKVGELIETIKETSLKEAIDQVKSIFIWKNI